jgi:2Fe-2S iron-sulfur cluster binding domain.
MELTSLFWRGPESSWAKQSRNSERSVCLKQLSNFEAFEAYVSGDLFKVIIANKGKIIEVSEGERFGMSPEFQGVPSSCCVGNCGTCRVFLKQGRVDHRGTALADEKATSMLFCISRGIGCITIGI